MSSTASAEDVRFGPAIGEKITVGKSSYTVIRQLGRGVNHTVYEVHNKDKKRFALKCGQKNDECMKMYCYVVQQTQHLKSRHFAFFEDCGRAQNRFNWITTSLLGLNLRDLLWETETLRFNVGTALKAADQTLVAIQQLHSIGYLHRDIRPTNFCIGLKQEKRDQIIYLVGFSLCRTYKTKDNALRNPRARVPFRGTVRYSSIAGLKGCEVSRKDDLESWFYMVLEWTAGYLPWQKFKTNTREDVILAKEELRSCEESQRVFDYCPSLEYNIILKHIDGLGYYETPEYGYFRSCLAHAMKVNEVKSDEPLDWAFQKYVSPDGTAETISIESEKKSAEHVKHERCLKEATYGGSLVYNLDSTVTDD